MRSLVKFFLITYAASWTFGAAAALADGPGPRRELLILLGTFAPSVVAVGLTARADGDAGVRSLLRRLFEWRVGARWYVFAAGYLAAIKLAVAVVHRMVTGEWPAFGLVAWYVIAAAIVLSTPVQAGEEVGWRGYALPRLGARLGLAGGSIVLGLLWALWHVPVFFIPGTDNYGQSFPVYALGVTAISVAMAWLYAHTNGSLLLAMLMHSALNQTRDIVPSSAATAADPLALSTSVVAWLTLLFLCIGAGWFLVWMPRMARAGTVAR